MLRRRTPSARARLALARSSGGVLSSIATLSPLGQDAAVPQIGVGSAGQAVATWQQTETPYTRIQASGGP